MWPAAAATQSPSVLLSYMGKLEILEIKSQAGGMGGSLVVYLASLRLRASRRGGFLPKRKFTFCSLSFGSVETAAAGSMEPSQFPRHYPRTERRRIEPGVFRNCRWLQG